MSLKYGKAEIGKVVEALDREHETAEEAALATLDAMEGIFESRAKFVVVGQLSGTRDRQSIPPDDPEAIKLALGWYSTEGDAIKAAESLTYSGATNDSYRVWVLPMLHLSIAEFNQKSKEKYANDEEQRKEKQVERLQASIRKHEEAMNERARGGKGSCDTCGHLSGDHRFAGQGRGECVFTDCPCDKWIEKRK